MRAPAVATDGKDAGAALQPTGEGAPPDPASDCPADSEGERLCITISLDDHRLWLTRDGNYLLSAPVATGSGDDLLSDDGLEWHFETPQGWFSVEAKEENPVWNPPEWHYVEVAQRRELGLEHLERNAPIVASDSSLIQVEGDEVIRSYPDGRSEVLDAGEGKDIVVDDMLIVPPRGTRQREYTGVLGAYRLKLGHGYALHGTDEPKSIGRSATHGCIRLKDEDIKLLYGLVPVGTPVLIY